MTPTSGEVGLYIFILAGFLGYHVISRVPPLLHTPLMSATNAIVGHLAGRLPGGRWSEMHGWLSTVARFHRRQLFHHQRGRRLPDHRSHARHVQESERDAKSARWLSAARLADCSASSALVVLAWPSSGGGPSHQECDPVAADVLRYLYIVSAVLFILGLKGLSSPQVRPARGMFLAEFGMLLAVVGTLFDPRHRSLGLRWIVLGLLIGSVVGGIDGPADSR